jgi:hypothetical protein
MLALLHVGLLARTAFDHAGKYSNVVLVLGHASGALIGCDAELNRSPIVVIDPSTLKPAGAISFSRDPNNSGFLGLR